MRFVTTCNTNLTTKHSEIMKSDLIQIDREYGIREPRHQAQDPLRRATVVGRSAKSFEVVYAEPLEDDSPLVGPERIICPWEEADERMRADAERAQNDPDADDLSNVEAARMLGVTAHGLNKLLMDSAFRRAVCRRSRSYERRYIITRPKLQAWIDDPERRRKEDEEQLAKEARHRARHEEEILDQDPGNWQEKDVLTVDEIAAVLRLSRSTALSALSRGEIPGGMKVGSKWRVARSRFEHFLNSEPEPVRFTLDESLALLGRAITVTQTAYLDFERAITGAVELGATWDQVGAVLNTSGRQAETWHRNTVNQRMNSMLWPPREPTNEYQDLRNEPTARSTLTDPRSGEELPLLITMSAAAQLLGVSSSTVRAMFNSGKITTIQTGMGRSKIVTAKLLEQMGAL